MPLLDDGLHTVHGRQREPGQDCTKNYGARCDAPSPATEEQDGLHQPGKILLLHLHPEHHPRRGRPDRRAQIAPAHTRTTHGELHTLGSSFDPGRTDEEISLPTEHAPSVRSYARQPY